MFFLRRLTRVNYEKEMRLLDVLCDRNRTSVDVGAKLGMYTYRILRHSRDVVSFEPIPTLAGMLTTVFAGKPVRIVQRAVSDAPGSVTMRIPYGSDGEVKFGRSTIEKSNTLTHDDVAKVEEIEVVLTTLDTSDLKDVGFIKIDVEGHELSVLRGATALLDRDHPNLLVEANDHHHPGAVRELRDLMTARGYQGWFLAGGRLMPMADVTDPDYFQRESIENFLFVHSSRPEVVNALRNRHPS